MPMEQGQFDKETKYASYIFMEILVNAVEVEQWLE